MTKRPVFMPKLTKPYFKTEQVEFEWNPGQAQAQKLKNSQAIQEGWLKKHPDGKILEVSTKSRDETGQALSPFHLTRKIPSLKKEFPVENIYHASKVFKKGGPYVDLLGTSPLASKRDERLNNSGELIYYQLENETYPSSPSLLYYNWLYLTALMEHPGLAKEVLKQDAFCDVEMSPEPNSMCQARACAIYSSLARLGLLDQAKTFEGFKNLMMAEDITEIPEQSKRKAPSANLEELRKAPVKRRPFQVGQWIEHPSIGVGEVIKKTPSGYLVNFRLSGPRTLSKDFTESNCHLVNKEDLPWRPQF